MEKGREFRVIVDEIGLDILKVARKIKARASIGRTGRRARRCAKDAGHVFCELKELEIQATSASFDIASLAAIESQRKPNFSLGGVRPLTVRAEY